MAGRQVMLSIEDVHTISGFHRTVKDQITYNLHRYKLPLDDVEYVGLCFREVNLHLITVVKLDPVVNRIENAELELIKKSIKIPVSINPLQIPIKKEQILIIILLLLNSPKGILKVTF